jgi:hypothetical protein
MGHVVELLGNVRDMPSRRPIGKKKVSHYALGEVEASYLSLRKS